MHMEMIYGVHIYGKKKDNCSSKQCQMQYHSPYQESY